MTTTGPQVKEVWKDTKEVHSGEKCSVSMYEEHCRYSNGSDPGGFSIINYVVTDDSSEKAYRTLSAMRRDMVPPLVDDTTPINDRASKAVDVA
jgi:hypothetical protein